MRSLALSFAAGLVFGVGLLAAGMTRPAKVLAFLDVLGTWDASLAFVMIGAIGLHFVAYRLVRQMPRPLWGASWRLPTRRDVDWRLLVGATLFGVGWGLGGYCPGPAIVSVASGATSTLVFTGSMLAGMWGYARWEAAQTPRTEAR